MSYSTSRKNVTAARICTTVAFVSAGLAVLVWPILFGLFAVVLGLVGGFLGDRPLGFYAAAAGAAGAVLGIVLATGRDLFESRYICRICPVGDVHSPPPRAGYRLASLP
jgi:hypothetical protein